MNPFGRRQFLLSAALLLALRPARAQPGKATPRIGFLLSSTIQSPLVAEISQRLREFGHVEGRHYLLEIEDAEGKLERIPGLVDKLVQKKVDILVLTNNIAIQAAKKATQTIPIVMLSSIDPIGAGYVTSLSRPGGNITGVALLTRELSAKRVEIMKELVPGMDRLAILWDAEGPGPLIAFKAYEATALKSKVRLQSLEVRGPRPDLEAAFRIAKERRADALIVVTNPLLNQHAKQIIELAQASRLPTMHEFAAAVSLGGLVSYGGNVSGAYRRLASYVDRLLRGAKASELPIEQPTKFDFVLNARAARAIGLQIPQSMLLRADQVIE